MPAVPAARGKPVVAVAELHLVGERHEVVGCQVGGSTAVDAAVVVSGVDALPLGGADPEAGLLCGCAVAGVVAAPRAAIAS